MAHRGQYWLAWAGTLMLLSGCVERRFIIESTPPGAKVYVDYKPVGSTPCEVSFLYYGKHLVQLELDGHQTRIEKENIQPPWFAYPPIDFFAENVYPFTVKDVQRKHYDLTLLPRPNLDELQAEAEALRQRGRNLPPPTLPPEPRNGRTPPPPPLPGAPAPINRNETLPPPLDPIP